MTRGLPVELFLGFRYLRSRGQRTNLTLFVWIGVGGVFLGVAALIVVLAVMTGFQEAIRDRIIAANPHLLVFQIGGGGLTGADEIAERIRTRPGVRSATPFVLQQALFTSAPGGAHGGVGGRNMALRHFKTATCGTDGTQLCDVSELYVRWYAKWDAGYSFGGLIYTAMLLAFGLLCGCLGQRLGADPTMGRDVNHHRVRPFVFFLEEAGGCRLGTIEAMLCARLIEPAADFLYIVHPKAKVMQAEHGPQSILTVRSFNRLETEDRQVNGPVAQINAFGDRRIRSADLDHVENTLVKFCRLFRIGSMESYVTEFRHDILLSDLHTRAVAGAVAQLEPDP